jgi:hypothetical protein
MLDQILEELRLDSKLCKIDRGYKCGPEFGVVIGFTEEVVAVRKYDRDGLYDGLKVFLKSDIETLLYSGNEIAAITKFIQNRGDRLDKVEVDCSGFDRFIESACNTYGYVSVNIERDPIRFIGPVIGYDDDYLQIRNFGNPTRRDKQQVVIAKWTISSMDVDDIYSRNLMSIHTERIRVKR